MQNKRLHVAIIKQTNKKTKLMNDKNDKEIITK